MEPKISYTVGDELIAGVITTATLSEKQRPGLWQDMLRALDRGAAGTEAGTEIGRASCRERVWYLV